MRNDRKFDFKDLEDLEKYLSGQGDLMPAKRTGLTAREQRRLKRAVKYARFLALIPYNA